MISRWSDEGTGEEKNVESLRLRITCGTNRPSNVFATPHFQDLQL
jgi:hypothetical protein